MSDAHVRYSTDGRLATITLDRPERLNAISMAMPEQIEACVRRANDDNGVHAIVVQGAGRAFCAGYDLKDYAESPHDSTQDMPWDPMLDYRFMRRFTECFTSLWQSYKPTICKVQGFAVAGGSDIALCCDVVLMSEDARIGYPPARVWGCPTTAMWVHRVGPVQAKRMLLTGDLIDGIEAKRIGLVTDAVPADGLDEAVNAFAQRVASIPKNQLMMQKLVINQAVEGGGLSASQTLATVFDGITRHSPEGLWFKRRAEQHGFADAVAWRDSGRPLPDGRDGVEAAEREDPEPPG